MSFKDTNDSLKKVKDEQEGVCCANPTNIIGVEYAYGHPHRYDGISEIMCNQCGTRRGRWSGKILEDGEFEPRYGRK